jgi:hypothetical protein
VRGTLRSARCRLAHPVDIVLLSHSKLDHPQQQQDLQSGEGPLVEHRQQGAQGPGVGEDRVWEVPESLDQGALAGRAGTPIRGGNGEGDELSTGLTETRQHTDAAMLQLHSSPPEERSLIPREAPWIKHPTCFIER